MTANRKTIEIIAYDDRYARAAVKMWRDSKQEALKQKDIHSFNNHLNFLQSVLIKENKVFLAVDKPSETVVGLLAINGSRLNQLYIHNDYQKTGIGSRLLNLAKELSPGKLELFTFEVNNNARAFYEKHGFKIVGRGFENEENLPDIKYEWLKIIDV
jgi:ribosomal protein S18 acetylase RimI-like enzyme